MCPGVDSASKKVPGKLLGLKTAGAGYHLHRAESWKNPEALTFRMPKGLLGLKWENFLLLIVDHVYHGYLALSWTREFVSVFTKNVPLIVALIVAQSPLSSHTCNLICAWTMKLRQPFLFIPASVLILISYVHFCIYTCVIFHVWQLSVTNVSCIHASLNSTYSYGFNGTAAALQSPTWSSLYSRSPCHWLRLQRNLTAVQVGFLCLRYP